MTAHTPEDLTPEQYMAETVGCTLEQLTDIDDDLHRITPTLPILQKIADAYDPTSPASSAPNPAGCRSGKSAETVSELLDGIM